MKYTAFQVSRVAIRFLESPKATHRHQVHKGRKAGRKAGRMGKRAPSLSHLMCLLLPVFAAQQRTGEISRCSEPPPLMPHLCELSRHGKEATAADQRRQREDKDIPADSLLTRGLRGVETGLPLATVPNFERGRIRDGQRRGIALVHKRADVTVLSRSRSV